MLIACEGAVQDGDLVLSGGERAVDEGSVWWWTETSAGRQALRRRRCCVVADGDIVLPGGKRAIDQRCCVLAPSRTCGEGAWWRSAPSTEVLRGGAVEDVR